MSRKRKKIPAPVPMDVPDSRYQPSKAELEEEQDMPDLTEAQAREAFMHPFRFSIKKPDDKAQNG